MNPSDQIKIIEAVTSAMGYIYEDRLYIMEKKLESLIKYTAGTLAALDNDQTVKPI